MVLIINDCAKSILMYECHQFSFYSEKVCGKIQPKFIHLIESVIKASIGNGAIK